MLNFTELLLTHKFFLAHSRIRRPSRVAAHTLLKNPNEVSQPCHARYDKKKWFVVRHRPVIIVILVHFSHTAKLPIFVQIHKYEISFSPHYNPKLHFDCSYAENENTLVHEILIIYNIT